MNKRQKKNITRRSFLKRSGALGMAAAAAGLTGGLAGCPAGAQKAERAYALTAASAVVTSIEDGGSGAYALVLEGVAGKVAWADAAAVCDGGGEPLDDFLTSTWPAAFAVLPPHGTLAGRRLGRDGAVGFRVIVQHLEAGDVAGRLTGRLQAFDELWEEVEGFMRGDPIVLENVTLHLLPTMLDEEDPEHLLVHFASSVKWADGALVLQGVSDYAGWLHNGAARLGGREHVSEHVAEWDERYGSESVEAWLWQTEPDGTPVVNYLTLRSGRYDSLNERLTFQVDDAKSATAKSAGAATLFMDGGVVEGRPDSDDFAGMRFTQGHLWVLREGNSFRIGLTDLAQSMIGDVMFVDYVTYTQRFEREEPFAEIDSVKARSEIFTPLNATVIAYNDVLADTPYAINFDPYGQGWLMQASCDDFGPMRDMMTYQEYQDFVNSFENKKRG